MRTYKYIRLLILILMGIGLFTLVPSVFAAGTASGTVISNQAIINYSVGGISQTPVNSDGDAGTSGTQATTFVVDNSVDLTVVTTDATYVDVIQGADGTTGAVQTFTVTNTGNTVQDYALAAAHGADPFGGTDNFDANNLQVFVEDGTTAGYQAAEDTETFIDELAADASATVYVIAEIPADQPNGDISAVTLTATTADGGTASSQGSTTTEDSADADDPTVVQVVFSDGSGANGTDADNDGTYSDTSAFRVGGAQITVTKTATVIRDPVNADTNPKAIPGAFVRYTITITNSAAAPSSAELTTLTDALDANSTIDPDLVAGATGTAENADGNGFRIDQTTTRTVITATEYYTTADDNDGVDHDGGTPGNVDTDFSLVLPADGGQSYTAGELKPGDSVSVIFNVTIN